MPHGSQSSTKPTLHDTQLSVQPNWSWYYTSWAKWGDLIKWSLLCGPSQLVMSISSTNGVPTSNLSVIYIWKKERHIACITKMSVLLLLSSASYILTCINAHTNILVISLGNAIIIIIRNEGRRPVATELVLVHYDILVISLGNGIM